MNRSLALFLFAVVVSTTMVQTESLAFATVVRSVRRAGVWGKPSLQEKVSQQSPPAVHFDQDPTTLRMDGFDADAYRREMTDLVYQRSLKRGF